MSVLDIFKKKKNQEVNPTEDNATTADAKEDSTRQETPKPEITIKMQFGHEGEGRNVYVVGAGTIPEDERKYYNPDEYYQNYAYNGLVGDEILPFEQRKKTQKPSARGLYPAEIMLLQYCTFGSYPFPRNGYPGLWWYKYGIRDVISYLGSLEARGFLRRSTIDISIHAPHAGRDSKTAQFSCAVLRKSNSKFNATDNFWTKYTCGIVQTTRAYPYFRCEAPGKSLSACASHSDHQHALRLIAGL